MRSFVSPFFIDEEQSRKMYGKDIDTPFGSIQWASQDDFFSILASKFLMQLNACKQFRAGYYDDLWAMCDEAYSGTKKNLDLVDTEKEYRSNLRIRYLFKQVESQTSKIVPSIVNQNPPCSIFPNDSNDETKELKAKAIQKILQYNIFQRQNGINLVYRWIKQGEKYGLSPLKLTWRYEEDEAIVRRPVLDANGRVVGLSRVPSDGKIIVKDFPEIRFVNTRRTWWNPDASDPDEDLRYVYEEYFLPLKYVKESDLYFNTEVLCPESDFDQQYENTARTGGWTKYFNTAEDLVKVVERWDKDSLIVYAQNRIIRYRDNPFDHKTIPYFWYRSTIVDGDFVGIGCIEPNLDLEQLANTIHNQRIDNVSRIINKMIFIGATAGWKGGKRMRFRPCGIEQMVDINQIKEFQMQDVTASAYIEQDKAARLMDDISGDPEVSRGETGQTRETATSVSTRTAGASFRIEMKTLFAQIELARLNRAMYELEKQFGDPNRFVPIVGMEGTQYFFRHEDLFVDSYEFDYTLNGYTGNRLIDFQQFMLGIQAMATTGIIQEFDLSELAKVFAERSNIRGVDRLMKKPVLMMEGYNRNPYEENKRMFMYGEQIQVLVGERHDKHLPVHARILDVPGLPENIRQNALTHFNMHQAYQQAQMQQQAQAMSGMIQQMSGQVPMGATTPMGVAQMQAGGSVGMTQGGANVTQRGVV